MNPAVVTPIRGPWTLAAALMVGAAALPAMAAGLSASSAVGGSSASVAGSSASSASSDRSSERSSDSSSKTQRTAEGRYRIVDVAKVAAQPGMVRLRLQPTADAVGDAGADAERWLELPQSIVDQARLGRGDTVAARHRPYGVEFARADTQRAFFLVLDDDWYRELASNPVVL